MDVASALMLVLGAAVGVALGRSRLCRPRLASAGGDAAACIAAGHARQIFDHAVDGLFLIEVLGPARFRNLAVNPALLRLMGMCAEQLVGRLVHETAVPSTAASFVARYQRCVDAGVPQREQITMVLPAGRRNVAMTLVPLRDAAGRIHQLVGSVHDLTDRIELEATLAAREREFRTLVENSPDLIVRYDQDCRRVYVNPAFASMHGQPVQVLLGKTPADTPALDENLGTRLVGAIREVVSTGKMQRVAGSFRRRDGQWREGDLLLVPEADACGQVRTVLGLGRDVTLQRRQEAELERSRGLLRSLLASRISRELREELGQVLTALRLSAGMLRVQYADKLPPLLAASHAMTDLVDRAIGTMRELLRGLQPAALEDGIGAALHWLVQDLRRRYAFECRLHMSEAPELGRESAAALFGIVQEALENSVRHAGVNSAELSIQRIGERWELVVRDVGRGFDPAAIGAQSYGLEVMKARSCLLGGELQIISGPAMGVQVRLNFPSPRPGATES